MQLRLVVFGRDRCRKEFNLVTPVQRARAYLENRIEEAAAYLLPGGKKDGSEWRGMRKAKGGPGDSVCIHIAKDSKLGLCSFFASGEAGTSDIVATWMRLRGIPADDWSRFFSDLRPFAGQDFGYGSNGSYNKKPKPFARWAECVAAVTEKDLKDLAEWRGLSIGYVTWLRDQKLIGRYHEFWAFPVISGGVLTSIHYFRDDLPPEEKNRWRFEPPGFENSLFVIGDLAQAEFVHAFESQWDLLAVDDVLDVHHSKKWALVATRGTKHAKLLAQLPETVKGVKLWPQTDGPGQEWMADAAGYVNGRVIKVVRIPTQFKDAAAWIEAGADQEMLERACRAAEEFAAPAPEPPSPPPPAQQPSLEQLTQELGFYYDWNRTSFWLRNDVDAWMLVTVGDVRRRLKEAGYRSVKLQGENVSQVDSILTAIQHYRHIEYAGDLAGWNKGVHVLNQKRILVLESPKLLEPCKGEWSLLEEIITRMLGHQQIVYLFGWLKVALESLYANKWRSGQALVLCGPADSFKSRLQKLVTIMFGGRCAKPYRYLSGATEFNADLVGSEHLVIEDEDPSSDIRARRAFGVRLKEITANEDQSCHAKFRTAITLAPFWRLSISLNAEPENVLILPPIDNSTEDKLILLKVDHHPMPMPTTTDSERVAFMEALKAELPALVWFLLHGWSIPPDYTSPRYGVTHFHHPEILEALNAMAPETRLLELIDLGLWASPLTPNPWIGTASELEQLLCAPNSPVQRDAQKLLTWQFACGTYLGRLKTKCPERVDFNRSNSSRQWTIHAPNNDQ
jgi:hypothetical protein